MRVIFKKSVVDKINEAIDLTKSSGKKIDRIELSADEWREFADTMLQREMISREEYVDLSYTKHGALYLYGEEGVPIAMVAAA